MSNKQVDWDSFPPVDVYKTAYDAWEERMTKMNNAMDKVAFEEFRLWAKVKHPEVNNFYDALHMCSVAELVAALSEIPGVVLTEQHIFHMAAIAELKRRLDERAALKASHNTKVQAVSPDE